MSLKSLNKVCLIGVLGKDPAGGTTKNGKAWCSFSMATSEGYKDKNTNEWIEQTEWHNVKTFNERIVNLVKENLKKGSKVYVEGQMKTEKYNENGVDKFATSVVIPMFGGELVLLDKKEKTQAAAQPAAKSTNPQYSEELADEIVW